jgi:general secretion pathway protein D
MRRAACVFVLATLMLGSPFAAAETEQLAPAPGEDAALYHCNSHPGPVEVTLKPELELKELVAWAMGFTCKNFLYDPSYVQRGKKVTLIAPNKMSASEAYRVFLAALSTIGLTVVPKGNVLRIVESATAKAEALPILHHGLPDDNDQVVRYVLRPSYAQVGTIQQALATLKSAAGDVQAVGSLVIITDYATQLRDMLSVVKLIDVPGGSDGIYTLPVHYADAEKLVKELDGILGPAAAAAATAAAAKGAPDLNAAVPTKLMVDKRTNTIVALASEVAYQRLSALVSRLDIAVETESGGTLHVYQLHGAIAEEVAKTLNDAINGQSKTTMPTTTPASATAATATGAAAVSGPLALEGQARVIADKPTNKLIIMSTARDFIALKSILEDLDEPRRQVYIEATILEVGVTSGLDLGAAAHAGVPTKNGNAIVLGGVESESLNSTNLSTLANKAGLIGGLIGSPLTGSQTFLGMSIPSYAVLFQALAHNSNTNVLSAPSIIALDNEDAKYKVGTTIPYLKGTIPVSASNPLAGTAVNIDHIDLALELDIKPHISGDSVLLEIKHESKDFFDKDPQLGPSWTTRSFETRVVVPDQQTVVIGGLMQEHEDIKTQRVPLLGDLPLLGYLFKYTSKSKVKTNLVVMLTPYIIKDQLDLELIRQRRAREQDEFIGSMQTLDGARFDPHIDYRKKRGLVEEINRSIQAVEEDAAARAAFMHMPGVEAGPVAPKESER